MPVTVVPADHKPKRHPDVKPAESEETFLWHSCWDMGDETHVLASHRTRPHQPDGGICPSKSSLLRCVIEAWGRHSHLVLRPDEFWFTILLQLKCYIGKNTEELGHLLVSDPDLATIVVKELDQVSIEGGFRRAVRASIREEWVTEWISPGFTTSTDKDDLAANVIMMGLMKGHFGIEIVNIICGIPSITLLGCAEDWQRLLQKVDRFATFGIEPAKYAERLRPILARIVRTFDNPSDTDIKDFWNQIVQAKARHDIGCERPDYEYMVSGWILGLFYWDCTGVVNERLAEGRGVNLYPGQLSLDGITYGEAALQDIPAAYAKAKIRKLNLHHDPPGEAWNGWFLAGCIGKSIAHHPPEGYDDVLCKRRTGKTTSGTEDESMKWETTTVDEIRDAGCYSGLRRRWQRLWRRDVSGTKGKNISAELISASDGKESLPSTTLTEQDADLEECHSTMQPLAGWFLYGPRENNGPVWYDEELTGPTVDAIESCGNVEHIRWGSFGQHEAW